VAAANAGSGSISGISLHNVKTPPLGAGPITLTLTYSGLNTLDYDDGNGSFGSITYTPGTDSSGKTLTAALSNPPAYEFDVRFTAGGTPAVGDSFTINIADNGAVSAISDNRNALLMDGLQQTNSMLASNRPTATYQDAFANYVAATGSKTRQANVNLQAQEGLLEVNRDAMQTVSGVNLDEEAANLIRYQQAYQAAAQVISTAKTVFDTLISSVR
jgi:flagellar hook-associated protein 1 FlgK